MSEHSKTARRHYVSWTDIDHACNDILDQILLDGKMPKRIVGLTRGGLIPAVILSHKSRIPMSSLDWQTRDGTTKEALKLQRLIDDLVDPEDTILVIDDIADSGRTFASIKAAIPAGHESQIVFAALTHKSSSEVEPEYYSTYHNARENVWFVYPWESTYNPRY